MSEKLKFEKLSYKVNEGSISIVGCEDDVSEVVIPSEIDGLPVTSIEDGSFVKNSNLTSITISEGVTNIEEHAFFFCWELSSITIPKSVTSIGNRTFGTCYQLKILQLMREILTTAVLMEYCLINLAQLFSAVQWELMILVTPSLRVYPQLERGLSTVAAD